MVIVLMVVVVCKRESERKKQVTYCKGVCVCVCEWGEGGPVHGHLCVCCRVLCVHVGRVWMCPVR